jgi:hypothetical protein
MTNTCRNIKRSILIGGALTLLSVMLVVVIKEHLPNPAITEARNKSIRLLAQAADAEAMEEAVDGLGIIFHLADRSWVAIRYRDSHAHNMWSSGVALDSKGRWYESDRHFCGQFEIYRHQWKRTLEVLKDPKATKDDKKLYVNEFFEMEPWHVEGSPDLESARDNLLKLGFREYDPKTVPTMSGVWPETVESKTAVLKRLLQ